MRISSNARYPRALARFGMPPFSGERVEHRVAKNSLIRAGPWGGVHLDCFTPSFTALCGVRGAASEDQQVPPGVPARSSSLDDTTAKPWGSYMSPWSSEPTHRTTVTCS